MRGSNKTLVSIAGEATLPTKWAGDLKIKVFSNAVNGLYYVAAIKGEVGGGGGRSRSSGVPATAWDSGR